MGVVLYYTCMVMIANCYVVYIYRVCGRHALVRFGGCYNVVLLYVLLYFLPGVLGVWQYRDEREPKPSRGLGIVGIRSVLRRQTLRYDKFAVSTSSVYTTTHVAKSTCVFVVVAVFFVRLCQPAYPETSRRPWECRRTIIRGRLLEGWTDERTNERMDREHGNHRCGLITGHRSSRTKRVESEKREEVDVVRSLRWVDLNVFAEGGIWR